MSRHRSRPPLIDRLCYNPAYDLPRRLRRTDRATPPTTTTNTTTTANRAWRTAAMVLGLLCIALCVGWFMHQRQLRIDHDQERENLEIQVKSLQSALDARPPAPDDVDTDAPSTTRPTTRPS